MTALKYHDFGDVDINSEQSRKKLAKIVMNLFSLWKLDTATSLSLLGLSPTSRSLLSKYRSGKSGLPSTVDSLDRAGWLLSIHKALRLLYPQNEELRYSWIKKRNRLLDNRRPLEIMTEEGIIGIAKISRYLDHLRGI